MTERLSLSLSVGCRQNRAMAMGDMEGVGQMEKEAWKHIHYHM